MMAGNKLMKHFSIRLAHRIRIGGLLCIVICASPAQTRTKSDQELPDSSSRVFDPAKDPSLATIEAELRHELELKPDSASLLFRLGQVLLRENKPKESLDIYTRAARFQKPNAEQLRFVAMDYVLLKLYNDAIHWLQVAHSMDSDDVNVMYDLGRCFYTQSRFHEAEEMYVKVLKIEPGSIKAEENLGLTLDKEVQPDRAEVALRAAVTWAERQQTDEWPFLNLGTFLLEHARAGEAVPFLEKAVSTAPTNAVCHEKLGRALMQIENVQAGLSELESAARIDIKNPRIHFELGRAYRHAGQADKAASEFALSKSLYGEHSED
jgi:tetratricopeptide (TPR) repeat protein